MDKGSAPVDDGPGQPVGERGRERAVVRVSKIVDVSKPGETMVAVASPGLLIRQLQIKKMLSCMVGFLFGFCGVGLRHWSKNGR
ncbi:hypothetical protein TIFTF001_041217 [Ficus carica]|uniref:Uncharacterized protein n=1 Tax=Ficus carica TaxID=3494 RepID=A0AA87ZKR6_FICCA|nr:hypothetical protein TIFTF001_041217 [Ficus carica]